MLLAILSQNLKKVINGTTKTNVPFLQFGRLASLYVQGQAPEPKVREYFYYIDHEGMVINNKWYFFCNTKNKIGYVGFCCISAVINALLKLFLDDARIKNFTSCFKDKQFLVFFFKRLKRNDTNRYREEFPYLSVCGRERNFVRCDDLPVVFTEVIPNKDG